MKWISPKDQLPPQGKKILHFHKGDICVVQKIGEGWFPIPFIDSKYSSYEEPELWADIETPEDYTGYFGVEVDGKRYKFDELEVHHPDVYKEIVSEHLKAWQDYKKSREEES